MARLDLGYASTLLDSYDQRDLLAGTGPTKRKEFFYWTDEGNLAALGGGWRDPDLP